MRYYSCSMTYSLKSPWFGAHIYNTITNIRTMQLGSSWTKSIRTARKIRGDRFIKTKTNCEKRGEARRQAALPRARTPHPPRNCSNLGRRARRKPLHTKPLRSCPFQAEIVNCSQENLLTEASAFDR